MTRERLVSRPLAKRFGRYSRSWIAARTRSAVVAETLSGVLRTRLTVAMDTPARSATDRMETAPVREPLLASLPFIGDDDTI